MHPIPICVARGSERSSQKGYLSISARQSDRLRDTASDVLFISLVVHYSPFSFELPCSPRPSPVAVPSSFFSARCFDFFYFSVVLFQSKPARVASVNADAYVSSSESSNLPFFLDQSRFSASPSLVSSEPFVVFLQSKPAQGAQRLVGYKGSTMPGSAPPRRDGKPGVVYRLKVCGSRLLNLLVDHISFQQELRRSLLPVCSGKGRFLRFLRRLVYARSSEVNAHLLGRRDLGKTG